MWNFPEGTRTKFCSYQHGTDSRPGELPRPRIALWSSKVLSCWQSLGDTKAAASLKVSTQELVTTHKRCNVWGFLNTLKVVLIVGWTIVAAYRVLERGFVTHACKLCECNYLQGVFEVWGIISTVSSHLLLNYVPYQNLTSWQVKNICNSFSNPLDFQAKQRLSLILNRQRTSETGQRRGGDRKREKEVEDS